MQGNQPKKEQLSDEELLRYSRQIFLPEIDVAGQLALANSAVCIIGAGGLGSVVAPYLWAAGVGELHIFDHDTVDLTNLHRQLTHTQQDVGRLKAQSIEESLLAIRSDTPQMLHTYSRAFNKDSYREINSAKASNLHLLIDCSDNFATRQLVNVTSVAQAIPLVSGAAQGLDGQLCVFDPKSPNAACYHCLFGDGDEAAGNCNENGVLGPVVGVVGAAQALQALLMLTGAGEPIRNKLAVFDAANFSWRQLMINPDEQCAICGAI